MIGNYLKTALSCLVRHKLHSILNIAGLAVGLACCLIIALFVVQELSYDRHYANAERLYRVGRVLEGGGVSEGNSVLAAALLEQDFAGIEQAAGFTGRAGNPVLLARDELAFFEDGVGFADPGFFALFDFRWLQGGPDSALEQPGSIVLTATLAEKYFGNTTALGETLLMDNLRTLRVTGVVADLPVATHLRADAFVSMDVFRQQYADRGFDIGVWNFAAVSTYVLLKPGENIRTLETRFPDFVARHVPAGSTRITGLTATPLTDIHLQTDTGASLSPLATIVIFSTIALCILLIAGINFVNLSTAHASWRMLEVGLRKSMGASRHQLVQQFLGETCLLILLASLLALGLVELLLPDINALLGLHLSLAVLGEPRVFAGLCFLMVALGVLAGSYPAFYLSGFRPSEALEGKAAGGRAGLTFRNILVVLQFSIAIVLLVTSAVVFLQMRLASAFDQGYDRNQVVEFALPPAADFAVNTQWSAFSARMLEGPGILSATHSLSSPQLPSRIELEVGGEGQSDKVELVMMMSDPDFFATYRIPLVAGRAFSRDSGLDRTQRFDPAAPDSVLGNVMLNESAARQLGWSPQDAIGQFVRTDNGARYAVVGVTGDTVPSLKEGPVGMFFIAPAVFDYRPFGGGAAALRIADASLEEALAHIDTVWREFSPDEPIRRHFVSDQVTALYQEERMQGRLFSYAAFFAVLIACFGLLGLAAFTAERRTKEIGVRKVLGGSVWSIVLLLTNDFSRLVLLSNLIAWPVAYFAMERWLENFAWRIDLTPLIFIGSGLIALCIAWVTVGGTAAKAASAKPVLALRYE
jgi:putative ABC transport system permease protein